MGINMELDHFFDDGPLLIYGVSSGNSKKFGNGLFRMFQDSGKEIYAVNPKFKHSESGCYQTLSELPSKPVTVIMVTPPEQSLKITDELAGTTVKKIWYQQGSSDGRVEKAAQDHGFEIVTGQCAYMHQHPVRGIHGFHRWLKNIF